MGGVDIYTQLRLQRYSIQIVSGVQEVLKGHFPRLVRHGGRERLRGVPKGAEGERGKGAQPRKVPDRAPISAARGVVC